MKYIACIFLKVMFPEKECVCVCVCVLDWDMKCTSYYRLFQEKIFKAIFKDLRFVSLLLQPELIFSPMANGYY